MAKSIYMFLCFKEMEQRAQLLKKLAFVIFCSEVDQYQYCLPEIQERLAECLRLPQVTSNDNDDDDDGEGDDEDDDYNDDHNNAGDCDDGDEGCTGAAAAAVDGGDND